MAVKTLGCAMIGSGGDDVKFNDDTFDRFSFVESVSFAGSPPLSSMEPLEIFFQSLKYFFAYLIKPRLGAPMGLDQTKATFGSQLIG